MNSHRINKLCCLVSLITLFIMAFSDLCAAKTNKIKTRRITMIAFTDVVLLDIVGPLTVFSAANYIISNESQFSDKAYKIEILAEKKGPVRSHSGMIILADSSYLNDSHAIDTLMIPGGPGRQKASESKFLIRYLQKMNGKVRRLASICGGAAILAKAGLLDGKKATTHWNDIDNLADRHPDIEVKTNLNFIRDGHIYTSGGVLNGVQLALAFLEEDYGRTTALKVAKLIEMTYEH